MTLDQSGFFIEKIGVAANANEQQETSRPWIRERKIDRIRGTYIERLVIGGPQQERLEVPLLGPLRWQFGH